MYNKSINNFDSIFSFGSTFGYKNEEYSVPVGSSLTHKQIATTQNKETIISGKPRDYYMSLVHACILHDGILMISESRSTTQTINTFNYDDSFQKIFYSKKFQVGICSSGLNVFGHQKMSDLINDAEKDPEIKNLSDFIDRISSLVYYYSHKHQILTTIVFGYVQSDMSVLQNSEIKIIECNYPGTSPINMKSVKNKFSQYSAGVDWGQHFLKNYAEQHNYMGIDEYADNVIKIIKELIKLDHTYNEKSFIGGKIQVLKLSNTINNPTIEFY